METLLSLAIGVGLSAACGFRIFVPMLVMSIASLSGHLSLAADFDWIGSYPALVAFAVATLLEIGAYWIPWLDNLLDTVAGPVAVVAGIVATAACVSGTSPFLTWSLAIIAGGGAAGMVQAVTSVTRGASSVMTGGLANPLFSTAEAGGSVVLSAVAVTVPVLAVVLVLGFLVLSGRRLLRRRSEQGRAAEAK